MLHLHTATPTSPFFKFISLHQFNFSSRFHRTMFFTIDYFHIPSSPISFSSLYLRHLFHQFIFDIFLITLSLTSFSSLYLRHLSHHFIFDIFLITLSLTSFSSLYLRHLSHHFIFDTFLISLSMTSFSSYHPQQLSHHVSLKDNCQNGVSSHPIWLLSLLTIAFLSRLKISNVLPTTHPNPFSPLSSHTSIRLYMPSDLCHQIQFCLSY